MTTDRKLSSRIINESRQTPDPERAERNLLRFVETNPNISPFLPYLKFMASLFAHSQFLANYCISNPEELINAIKEKKKNITKRLLQERAKKELQIDDSTDLSHMMKVLRRFKKRYLLLITLRDLSGATDISSSMDELTVLAETIISVALEWSLRFNTGRFGEPETNRITFIGLGKLGGEELNYSSDVDLIAVYESGEGDTAGIRNPSGLMFNKISGHEFYYKTVEFFSKILSAQTEDGIAYRVDFRLRPQGQKGNIALPLKAYETYYESWGRTWERMMLIRARPVAGDIKLGKRFMSVIEPFVWRTTPDYAEIEEIRSLKKKIDSTFTRDDIKRGYGGIREVEFFIQTFQLLYAGRNSALKSYRVTHSIQTLKWMNIIPERDLVTLWNNYLYLRRLEHYLQMKEDLQIHSLPSSDYEMEVLARMMGFRSREEFLGNLKVKRMEIKNMYNSLLGTQEDVHAEALNLLEGKMSDTELSGYLAFRNVVNSERSLRGMKSIREHIATFRTLDERAIVRDVMPQLLEEALSSASPDRAIAGLEKLFTTYGIKTVHLRALKAQRELMKGVISLFSRSSYLTRTFISNQHYLDILIEEWGILKSLKEVEERLGRALEHVEDISTVLAEFRCFEEIRVGLLFLMNILEIEDLFGALTQLAEAIVKSVLERSNDKGLSVIALGKLGGREMTFHSDLDVIFVSKTEKEMKEAERVLKTLTAYTDMGLLYSVDTRLRPDGTKGILVNDINGYRNYYREKAQKWEIQALLKARPVGGNDNLGRSFIKMARDIILQRGSDVEKGDITAMRKRIVDELSGKSGGVDIKLSPGCMEEVEFFIQYLQLHHAKSYPDILVQNTLLALDRLYKRDIISTHDRNSLSGAYEFYRRLLTFLRLNEERTIDKDSELTGLAAKFAGYNNKEDFLSYIDNLRQGVLTVMDKY